MSEAITLGETRIVIDNQNLITQHNSAQHLVLLTIGQTYIAMSAGQAYEISRMLTEAARKAFRRPAVQDGAL